VSVTEANSFIPLTATDAAALQVAFQDAGPETNQSPVQSFIEERLKNLARQPGMLSKGAEKILNSIPGKNLIRERIKQTSISLTNDGFSDNLTMIGQYFKHGIAKSAFLNFTLYNTDTHDTASAQAQPQTYSDITSRIYDIIKFLKETPYDDARGISLFDVTTLTVGSEFDRTNRQLGVSVSNTGTDHNSLSNVMLFAGKGIRGGQVFGETDLDKMNERGDFVNVSKVHTNFDPDLIKIMGKPFNFEIMRPSPELPEVYQPDHYLTIASVINTLFTLFDVPKDKFLANQVGGKKASILSQLIV
jgi:hypothetical protein